MAFRPAWEIWRSSERPPLRQWWRSALRWERFLYLALPAGLLVTGGVPWLVTGSVLVGAIAFVGASLVLITAVVVITARNGLRGDGPIGTYWDPVTKSFRRDNGR